MSPPRLKQQTCGLRARAYSATTLRGDYAELLFSKTSIAIGSTCQSLKNLRADIIVGIAMATSSSNRLTYICLIRLLVKSVDLGLSK